MDADQTDDHAADEAEDRSDAGDALAPVGVVARLDALRREYLAKGLRYLAVSAFNVVFGQALLFGFQTVGGFEPVAANMAAVSISAVPAYLLSRYWVWNVSGKSNWLTEVAPFWGLTVLGFALSTLAVQGVSAVYDGDPPPLLVNVTNLSAFGVMWVAKFFVLDRWLFAAKAAPEEPPAWTEAAGDGDDPAGDAP
ncbi:MAG: GtrA family protein [Acidimicrobiales bacterium]|nr:GtrA family protein [Acidimicrobiales bacterium]